METSGMEMSTRSENYQKLEDLLPNQRWVLAVVKF